MAHICNIKGHSLHFEHPLNIIPLPLGDAPAHCVPFEFLQDNILGRGEPERTRVACRNRTYLDALRFGAIERSIRREKYVDFDHACQMYDIEGASKLNCFLDVTCLHVIAVLQACNQLLHLFGTNVSDDIESSVVRGTPWAMLATEPPI